MSYLSSIFFNQIRWFLAMEYRFIVRSARPRKMVIAILLSPLFWFYLLYTGSLEPEPFFYLSAFFLLSIGSFSYAQYFFSWQASFLVSIASLPVNWMAYFVARFVFVSLLTIYTALPSFLLFWNSELLPKAFAISFYFLGSVPACVLLQNARGVVSFDENQKGLFSNYIGKTVHQLIMEAILFGFPVLVYTAEYLIKKLPIMNWYLFGVGLLSIIALPFMLRQRCVEKIWLERIVASNEKHG